MTVPPPAQTAPPPSRKARFLRWGLLVLLLAGVAAFWFSGLHRSISLETVQAHRAEAQDFITAHPLLSGAAYIMLYTLVAALSLPVASLLTLSAGYLFGLIWGTALTVVGATIGATLIFLLARSTFGGALRARAGPLYHRIAGEMEGNATGYLLFLRLVPLFPFFVVNILPALFHIRLRTYIWTTAVGIIPGTAVYVNLGRSLGTISDPADLLGPPILAALNLFGLFALLPVMYRKIRKPREKNTPEDPHG